MILHIVRGLPGTGKTTFVQKQFKGMLQIENDQYWIAPDGQYVYGSRAGQGEPVKDPRKECKDYVRNMVVAAMQNKVNIAVSRVNMSYESVKELVDLAKTFGYDFKIWIMSAENRYVFGHDVHQVPKDALKAMADNFEWHLPWVQTIVGLSLSENNPEIEYDFHELAGVASSGG